MNENVLLWHTTKPLHVVNGYCQPQLPLPLSGVKVDKLKKKKKKKKKEKKKKIPYQFIVAALPMSSSIFKEDS
jgi:hypothetical protein